VTEADKTSDTQDKLKREAHGFRKAIKREVSLQQDQTVIGFVV